FYTVGYSALLRGSPNMDSLIAVGTTASFGYSIYSLIRIARGDLHGVHGLYFESVGVIITLILLGKMLEAISKGKTSQAIRSLMKLVPETARILREGEELEIPSEQLKEGDILILRPGSRIPADGIVKAGQSTVDESMLTGESLPIDKKADDSVFAGSINLNGAMQVVVSRVGEQTTLGEMIRLVEEAQGTKAPIARLADVVSGYFVPIVMLIALLAAAAWKLAGESWGFALSILVSVLVIACPCALGLATPTAIMVGIGKGAEYGILFKNGEAMELLHRMNTVVLDKTGTLTTGKPSLTDLIPADGFTRQDLLLWVASAEQSSEHPLARAIVDQAVHEQISLLTPEEFEALPGRGVLAKLGGMELLAGNERLMRERNISFGTLEQALNRLTGEGKTPVYIAAGGVAAGIAAIADTLKPDSFSAVQKLKNQGIEVVMLTGDDRRTAEAIAKEAGISEIQAEVLPGDKADVVKRLQEEGKRVAMVGDGINDAPALVTADVGIAIGSGTDVAMESADVVLMHSVLSSVPTAMELSRRTIRNIRQNLFWAFAYNTLGIPIAAGVLHLFGGPLLNPMLAAAAMSLSSVSVLLNALRLKRFKE
ncbi:MAG: copper-translocating P-type ATPase, partial [Clostridiales bacterium]